MGQLALPIGAAGRSVRRPRRARAARVRAHLLARLAGPYDLSALSRAFHVSTRTTKRRFRAETGETPLTYLRPARVTHAQRPLGATGLGIADIARGCGYRDARASRQLFAERAGIGPAVYRRAFRDRAADRVPTAGGRA